MPAHDAAPHPGVEPLEGTGGPIPAVELADDADTARVRRPNGEAGAVVPDVRPEHVPEPLVLALPEQVQVELRREAGRLGEALHVVTAPRTRRSMPTWGIVTSSGRWPSS